MADQVSFQHFNLNEINPDFTTLPEGLYTLRVNKLTPQTFKGKDGVSSYDVVKGEFVVTDSEQYAGRRLWHTFWLNRSYDQRSLKRIERATGIVQEPGEGTFEAWTELMSSEQPNFKVPLTVVDDMDFSVKPAVPKVDPVDPTKTLKTNQINWKEILPA